MALNMLTRSFTASSLRSFWRYWNAGTNYFLLYYCYRPIRKHVSHSLALMLTFAFCGLAHDMAFVLPASLIDGSGVPFPFMTVWFFMIAACIVLAERFDLTFERRSLRYRICAHASVLIATLSGTVYTSNVW